MPPTGQITPRDEPILIAYEAECASGPVCTSAENLDPTGIRPPDRPGRS